MPLFSFQLICQHLDLTRQDMKHPVRKFKQLRVFLRNSLVSPRVSSIEWPGRLNWLATGRSSLFRMWDSCRIARILNILSVCPTYCFLHRVQWCKSNYLCRNLNCFVSRIRFLNRIEHDSLKFCLLLLFKWNRKNWDFNMLLKVWDG